jgi:hypothetical protein
VLDVRFNALPAQTGPLLAGIGAEGTGLTTTVVVPAVLVHPATVAVTEYVPAIAIVAFAVTDGSSTEAVNAFGPVHE